MNGLFLASVLVMSLLAFALIARPFLPSRGRLERGFAVVPLLSVVLVLLFAVGMYLSLGRPDAAVSQSEIPVRASSGMRNNVTTANENNVGSVASMLDGLVERLKQEPDDAGGWLLLAKSYKHLGQLNDARDAYAQAKALGKSDPSLESAFGTSTSKATTAAEIRGRISIAPDAVLNLSDSDTVFVIAKAAAGSPMPLAVVRKRAADLPFDFVLDDESSMVQGMGLSSADKVVVSAKISRTGDALHTEPGYEVHSQPQDAHNAAFLDMVIDPAAYDGSSQADTAL